MKNKRHAEELYAVANRLTFEPHRIWLDPTGRYDEPLDRPTLQSRVLSDPEGVSVKSGRVVKNLPKRGQNASWTSREGDR